MLRLGLHARRATGAALAAILLSSTPAFAQTQPDETPEIRALPPVVVRPCTNVVANFTATDDPYRTEVEIAERARTLKLPQPFTVARKFSEQSRCFLLGDPDPAMWVLQGGMPEVIVRLRFDKLVPYERNLNDKISEGVRGYIESYTAFVGIKSEEGPQLLAEASITASILCPRTRAEVKTFTLADRDPPKIATNLRDGKSTTAHQNANRVERIVARLHDELRNLFAAGSPCGSVVSANPATSAIAPAESAGLKSATALGSPDLPSLPVITPSNPPKQ